MLPTLSFSAKDFAWFDRNGNPIVNDWILQGKQFPFERQKLFRMILEQEQRMVFNPEVHDPVELLFLYSQEELANIRKDIGLCIIMNTMDPYILSEHTFQTKVSLMEEIRLCKYRKPFEKALVRRLDKYTDFPTDINIIIATFAILPPYTI